MILAGALIDIDTQTVVGLIEAERRFGDSWKLEVVTRIFAQTDEGDTAHAFRRDSFVNLSLQRHL